MNLNDFKNFIELEKKYSKHTVISYISDLKEFIFFLKKNDSRLKENLNYSFVRKWNNFFSYRCYSFNSTDNYNSNNYC